ncbi:hypothetical protein D3C73_1258500 [compost metagenome]
MLPGWAKLQPIREGNTLWGTFCVGIVRHIPGQSIDLFPLCHPAEGFPHFYQRALGLNVDRICTDSHLARRSVTLALTISSSVFVR